MSNNNIEQSANTVTTCALTDLICNGNGKHDAFASERGEGEERFIVVPIAELQLSYSALNSPEILYLDATNQILLRCINGLTMIFDATFENTSPLAIYRLNPNARMIYDKHNGTLAIADSKMLCLRRDYGGTFLLKTALKRPSSKTVAVEIPSDEATKFLQIATNDPDSEEILKQRPLLRKFISQLRTAVTSLLANSMESVVVEINGKELLEQLRPLETPGGNSAEIPSEWLTFIWPYVSILGERVRLMLSPDRPYNFDYAPEWKGLNKEMMASEAARRLTFEHWPHMDYRWALPCQMAEAGFYHQPNNAGDDRVLCFACFVCLVCWEPSDEPWSEHERHSPKCRFVHNYTNPNVPLALTMSALSPFAHHLQVNHTSSLVFSAGSSEWIAIASRDSAEVHLWRTDSVVQVKQWFSLNSEKFFSAVVDCITEENEQPPRRAQRVTWSDDVTNLINVDGEDDAQQVNTVKGSSSDESVPKPTLTALLIDASCETVITALCTVGRPCLIEQSSIGAVTKKLSEQNQIMVVVGVSVNCTKLDKVRQQSRNNLETEIHALNTMNAACEFIDAPPRIVKGSSSAGEGTSNALLRPFVAIYQLDCAESFNSCKRTSPVRQEDAKPTEIKSTQSSDMDEADLSEGVLLMDTDSGALDWSGSTYEGQPSGFVDLPVEPNDVGSEMWGGATKADTKYDEKASYVPINYEAPPMDVSFVQCFRLPAAVDSTSMEISAVIPMQNIFLVVVVNNREPAADAIHSAVLIYLVHFGKTTVRVQKEPVKAYYYKDFRIMQFLLANVDLVSASRASLTEPLNNDCFDGAVIRTTDDMVYFINLNTNRFYSLCDEKVAQCTVMDNGKVTLLTRNSGKLITMQIEQSCSRRSDYEDEDADVAALFRRISDSQEPEVSKSVDREEQEVAKNATFVINSTTSILVSEHFSMPGLRRLWKLTRSDIGGPIRGACYRLPYHLFSSGGQPGYHLAAPAGWNEVPVNQRTRKFFFEGTPVEGVSRTVFSQSDCRRSSDIHIFELLHFQHGLRLSHVDICLTFHETCLACPDVEVRLYRRRNDLDDVPSSSKSRPQTSFSANADLKEVETQCDLIAGPYHCADYVDLNNRCARIQLPGTVFMPQPMKKSGTAIGFKPVPYYLILRALSDVSIDQTVTALKINERDKLKTTSTQGKAKSASKRRIGDSEVAETPQSASPANGESSVQGLVNRRGVQWIDELMVSVVKAKRLIEPNERVERRALIETTDVHNSLVMLAAGIMPKSSLAQKARTVGEKLQQQNLAIGIIEWLIDNWVNTCMQGNVSTLAEMIIENVDAVFTNCFIVSPRSITNKWSTILMYILRVLQKSDDAVFSKLLRIFLSCSIRIVSNLHAVRNAGSLHWLFVLIFALLKMAVMRTNDASCAELVNALLDACANTLTYVGNAWKQCWNGSVHEKLAIEYGLSGLPMELVMYEWPASVLSLWPRVSPPAVKLNDPADLPHSAAFPPATPTLIAYKWASAAAGYGKGFSEAKPSQTSGMSYEKTPAGSSAVSGKDCGDTSTHINALTAEDEMDWLTLFNLSVGGVKEALENTTEVPSNRTAHPSTPGTELVMGRFSAGCASNSQQECKYRTITTSTQLSGLLETEPLTFTIICASDHIKVENMETGAITEVGCTSAPLGHAENEVPVPLKVLDMDQAKSNKQSEAGAGSALTASKPGLQDLSADLNARMTLIAMEQAQIKEYTVMGSSEPSSQPINTANAESVAQGCTTQGSSASTFGIPTTPKTTPFMTPTPLSPSHLSPINSEPNLYLMETEPTNEKLQEEKNSRQNEPHAQMPSLIPMISPDIFKLPSQKVLHMERVTFGSRKFVILDFGVPVILTDFFIPSVAEIAAISIDVWLLGESVDGQRLLTATDICRKSIAVQDLQPSMRIRFVKITYIGRQVYNATCKIPLGLFFGHRYFSSWQIYSSPCMQRELLAYCMPASPLQQKQTAITVSHLRQLCEDMRCRHQLASAELNRLVDESASEEEVKQMYRECVRLSLQWNIVAGVVHRLELDQLSAQDSDLSLEKALHGSWNDCCPDQLQTVAVELFALVTQATHLIDVRAVALETFSHDNSDAAQGCYPSEAKYARIKSKETMEISSVPNSLTEEIVLQPKFSLDDAVTHFVLFCIPTVPRLQVGCVTWLFHNGSESDWWPLFFPRVLKEVFSAQLRKHDHKTFLLLSFLCNHSVKSSSKQAAIILELFNLIKEIADGAVVGNNSEDQSQNKLDVTLLCWTLMLLSSAFDVITYNKKKNDRWAFLSGDYNQGIPSNEKDDTTARCHKKKASLQSPPKYGGSDSLKNISTATLKTQLESLWEKHLKVMEQMKANMKMSEVLNAKMQKKIDVEKKLHALSMEAATSMDPSVFAEMEPSELSEELYATLFPLFGEHQFEEITAKKYCHLQNPNLKTVGDTSEYALKKAISSASKSSSRSSRSRQYSIRLKLPQEPCIEAARKLIRLLCDFEKQLPILAKLTVCKVVARICISASHHTIPLICVLEGPVDNLIKIGLEEQRTGLLKYAVLHLILDVIEAESRALAKSAASSKSQSFVKEKDSKAAEIMEELDELCMRYTGCHFTQLSLHAKSKNEAAEDMKGRKSTGITAAVCCLPDAFRTAKTSRTFSIANYDQQPELESESLETLIQQALLNTRQAVVPEGPGDGLRCQTYRRKAKEMIKEKLVKGEKFCYLFRWLDDLLEFDERAARCCNGDPEIYLKTMENQVSPSTPYEERTCVSKTAFVACCISEYMGYMFERTRDENAALPLSPIAEAGSSSPSVPGSPISRAADAEMKDENKAQSDVMEVMKNIDEFANTFSEDVTKAAAGTTEYDQSEAQRWSELATALSETPMEMEPCCSASAAFPESRIKKNLEKWMPAKWIPKTVLNKEIYLEHIMANFLAELRLSRNDVLIQPCSFVYGDPLAQQLGLNQHVYSMNMDFLADVITRYSIRDLSRWRVCLVSRPRSSEDDTMREKLGETLNATSAALGRFVQCISPIDSGETVQQLLTFCVDFQAGLASSTKKLPTAGKCILPVECVTSIVNFAVLSDSLSDQLWTIVLRVLDLIIKNDSSALTPLIESPHFCKLINNFLVKSIVRVNKSLTNGPATVSAFRSFITQLHESKDVSLRSTLCVKILTVLTDISERDDLINFSYPIDCLVELLNIMANYSMDYAAVAPQQLAKYISSSIHTARNFVRNYKSSGGYTLVSSDSYLRPNACFQVLQQKMLTSAQCGYESGDFSQYSLYVPEVWGQYGAQYSQLLDQFSDPRQTMRTDTANRFPALPRRQHQSNTFRQIAGYLDHSNEVAEYLVNSFPNAIEELFEIVARCESAVPDVSLISLENWNRVTLGDHALSMLLQISQRVSHETNRLFEIAVKVITNYASPSCNSLSKPIAFAFVQMLNSRQNQMCFAKLGGHLLVAQELERSILASANDWTAPISAPLMRQLASLSAQVAVSSESASQTSKLPADVRVDGLYNFAPLCTINSDQSPNVSGQLLSLISVAAPRRARSANWSYHFNEGSSDWFDITLILPYHIVLHEVQIRPHVPALNTAPAAVQVELCSETSLTQWCSLGVPLSTTGFNKIRISTSSYKLPVIAVRLYLEKPPDSTNLSLSQILLLGMNFTMALSNTCPKNTDFVQWLSVMVQLCSLEEYCIWDYAPELPRAVIALFLGRPLSSLVYCRISQLLYQIDDERAKPYSVVELIFQYIERGSNVTSESLEWLPDLLFTLCARKILSVSDDASKVHQICVLKQCQMLHGVTSVITSQNYNKSLRAVVAVLIWTASCVIWHNINVEERRFDTLAVCMDLAPKLLPFLCKMAVDASEQCNDMLAKSASWLLCSLMRAAPHVLLNALRELGLLDTNDRPKTEGITQNAFTVVQRMCQSGSSISQLHSFGLLQHWIELIITYCEESSMEHMSLLVSMVRCLASLCCIEDVVKFLDFACGTRLFGALIGCVVRCAASPGDMTRSTSKQSIKLEDATISLLSQCVTVGGAHRQRIAHVLCSLLKSAGGLNGAIQQMVLKCIFDDETIPVKAFDEDTSLCYLSLDIPNRILHPFFGCTRRERFLKVSLYTSMDEMAALFEHKCTSDFRQYAKIAVPDDDAHRFSSIVCNRGIGFEDFYRNAGNRSDLTTAFPSFTSSHLTIKSGDGSMEMMGDWKIGQLLGDLLTSGRLTSSAWKQRMAGGDAVKAAVDDGADGYYTIALSFVQRSGAPSTSTESYPKPNVTLTEQTSTLQYFARASGLALLAQHLQLYHPTFSASAATSLPSSSKGKSAYQRWLETSETVPLSEAMAPTFACPASLFSPPDPTTGEPVFSNLYVPIFDSSVFGGESDVIPGYEDFDYIDSIAPGEGKGWAGPLFAQKDNFESHATLKKLQKNVSQSANRTPSTGLSPHVVVAFSIFLRLEGYAELLVTYDRKRAKGLLRLAMGVVTAESASLLNKQRLLKPSIFRKSASQFQTQLHQKSECENLGSLPFIVLEELFSKYLPSTAAGKSLREAAVSYGVLDILLSCLSHYSHQKHKKEPVRPPGFAPAPETAVLVQRLLQGSAEAEQSQADGTSFRSAPEGRMNSCESSVAPASSTSGGTQQHSFWAKGTGFGSGTTQQQWNVDLHVLKRKQDEQNVTHLLQVLSNFIYPRVNEYLEAEMDETMVSTEGTLAPLASLDPEDNDLHSRSPSASSHMSVSDTPVSGPSSQQEPVACTLSCSPQWSLNSAVVEMLSRSCLLPAIWAYLRNDSVLDISQHVEVYEAVMQMVAALTLCPVTKAEEGEGDDAITALLSEPESGCSMHSMLKKLYDCVSAYLTRLTVESNETRLQNLNIQQSVDGNLESSQTREEGLMRLAPLITKTCSILSKRVKEAPVKSQNDEKDVVTEEEKYTKVMKKLQFETISFFSEGAFIPYHYEGSLSSVGTSSSLGKRTRRLAQEIVTLSNSLPLSASSSVFVRACEERLDVMKVLITGPADTPYMNGCFEFDVWFPTDYPNSPMHVNLETTGNHTVRFNPNLYNDGKVCLSVLNTWHGRPEERWNPETSSLLQVIVSVQSLILVAEPYFNEPGYERSKCTQAGQQASRDYDANIRQAVVKWAMLEMLRHPPTAFADVVRKHFWLKRAEILSQVSKWISETEQLVKQPHAGGRSMHAHLASLKRHAAALEDEFRRMECPADLRDTDASSNQQAYIPENSQELGVTVNEQQAQVAGVSGQVPPGNLESLSVVKILKL